MAGGFFSGRIHGKGHSEMPMCRAPRSEVVRSQMVGLVEFTGYDPNDIFPMKQRQVCQMFFAKRPGGWR